MLHNRCFVCCLFCGGKCSICADLVQTCKLLADLFHCLPLVSILPKGLHVEGIHVTLKDPLKSSFRALRQARVVSLFQFHPQNLSHPS